MKNFFNKYKKYIPNVLTTLRLGVVPVFWVCTLTGHPLIAAILFGSACATDALDGYLARKWEVESVYGKVTDPLADKMLVMSALLLNGILTNPFLLIPFALESGIAIVNMKDFMKDVELTKLLNYDYIKELVQKKNKVKVSQTGREKTVALMLTVSFALISSGLQLPLEKLINFLIIATSTIEIATLKEYIDAKIINKSSSKMRLPNFNKQNDEQNEKTLEKEKEKELSNNPTVEKKNMDRNERISMLHKEKDFLTKNTDNKKINGKKLH